MRKLTKRLLLTLALGLVSLFLTCIISFFISKAIPGDPVLAYLPDSWTQAHYDAVYHMLGLNQPIITQLFRYIGNMVTGNWGLSLTVSKGASVYTLIMDRITLTLFRLILPLILSIVLGFVLGNHSMKFKSRKGVRTVQFLSLIGIVIPITVLAISFQFFLNSINTIFDLVVILILLTISIIALTILLVRIYLNNLSIEASKRRSNIPFILLVGVSYAIIFLFLIQTEMMVNFEGIGELLFQAFSSADYYIINVIIFLILFSFPIYIIFSLFSFFLFGKVKSFYNVKKLRSE
ncbi:MAG: hypothetical protein JSV23_09180 [Promethearchaeota archaeon]|nr:MAG: hypothetical protein JSV23_09180 [Candidatus Lokiarchaeota archaeon]